MTLRSPLRTRAAACAGLAAAAGLGAGGLAMAQTDASPVSAAEQIVFIEAHLAGLTPPHTLHYVLEEGGHRKPATIELSQPAGAPCCTAHASFPAEEGSAPLPDVEGARANPVVLSFLEREVRQLQQRTLGSSAHFRQRIRLALADDARLTPTTVGWMGAQVPATAVTITPFATDPYRARFDNEARTRYTFVVSKAVPGMIVQLRADLPGTSSSSSSSARILTLEGATTPDLPDAAPSTPSR